MANQLPPANEKKSCDPLFVNKLAGGLLVACLFVFLISFVGEAFYNPEVEMEDKGYPVEVKMAAADSGAAAEDANKIEPIGPFLAKADAAKGEVVFKKCASCHDATKGGANKTGPELWGVVGRAQGKAEGFAFSDGMKAAGGVWDFENLNHFLANPKGYIAGTKMSFIGLPKEEDRANLLLWLNGQSDKPLPLP